jgi:hypothetical protein
MVPEEASRGWVSCKVCHREHRGPCPGPAVGVWLGACMTLRQVVTVQSYLPLDHDEVLIL